MQKAGTVAPVDAAVICRADGRGLISPPPQSAVRAALRARRSRRNERFPARNCEQGFSHPAIGPATGAASGQEPFSRGGSIAARGHKHNPHPAHRCSLLAGPCCWKQRRRCSCSCCWWRPRLPLPPLPPTSTRARWWGGRAGEPALRTCPTSDARQALPCCTPALQHPRLLPACPPAHHLPASPAPICLPW